MVQEAQLRDQEREVALKEAEEESRLQEQVFGLCHEILHLGPNIKVLESWLSPAHNRLRRQNEEVSRKLEKLRRGRKPDR